MSETPFISRLVEVRDLEANGRRAEVVATAAECEALARFNTLVALSGLKADLLLRPEHREGVSVTGLLQAKVVYRCVVTLEPFEADLSEPVEVHFLPEGALQSYRSERDARLAALADPSEEEDEPDVIVDDRIDLGALVAEHFTLGLDPYPRKPGATFVEPAPAHADPDLSPFAALKALKNNTD